MPTNDKSLPIIYDGIDLSDAPNESESRDTAEHEAATVRVSLPLSSGARVPMRPNAPRSANTSVDPRGRYKDLRPVGRGGSAAVRCVMDRWIMRQVALKRRHPTDNPMDLLRFVEEVQITGQLDHPNIVPVHDVELDDEGLPTQFTMKLVQGKTLKRLFASQPKDGSDERATEDFLRIFLKVCDAISFAHSRGVIHRDLKPDNVMVGSHGQVYVMDWGIAMLVEPVRPSQALLTAPDVRLGTGDRSVDPTGTLSGTPAYMAPEQAQGRNEDIDVRTDVYGLGGILYQFLTSVAPHAASNATEELVHAMAGTVVPPQDRAPMRALPPGLCRIAQKALASSPDDRYESVDELANDIQEFLRGGGWFENRYFEAGDVIVAKGEKADCAYIVTEGQCEVLRQTGVEESTVSLIGPGGIFGETGILSGLPRNATVRALSPTRVLVVTRSTLERELRGHRWLQAIVDAVISRYVEQSAQLSHAQDIYVHAGSEDRKSTS